MRNSVFILMFFLCLGGTIQAQKNKSSVVEGDIVVLGEAPASNYRYIDFPKKNIIIKRGAIANFNELIGERLVVQSLETDKTGAVEAVLTRRDGQNFFRFFPQIRANIEQAIESGELKTLNYERQAAIAQK